MTLCKHSRGVLMALTIAISLFSAPAHAQVADAPEEVAQLFANAAACIYYPHFDAPTLEEVFNSKELDVLAEFTTQLNLMIRDALGRGDSICGAYFSKHFRLTQNLDLLRAHILTPDRFYGWEGSYKPVDEPEFSDDQYVYDSKYIIVVEALTGEPVKDFLVLTDREQSQVRSIANDPDDESHEWALWLLRRLDMSESAPVE